VSISRVICVYDADAGIKGELAYLVGRYLAGRHCSLCDISHSPLKRKKEWDALIKGFPVPVVALHKNELEEVVVEAIGGRAPVVIGQIGDSYRILLDEKRLEGCQGSVVAFEEALLEAMSDKLS
jgi:hypothetical protein